MLSVQFLSNTHFSHHFQCKFALSSDFHCCCGEVYPPIVFPLDNVSSLSFYFCHQWFTVYTDVYRYGFLFIYSEIVCLLNPMICLSINPGIFSALNSVNIPSPVYFFYCLLLECQLMCKILFSPTYPKISFLKIYYLCHSLNGILNFFYFSYHFVNILLSCI